MEIKEFGLSKASNAESVANRVSNFKNWVEKLIAPFKSREREAEATQVPALPTTKPYTPKYWEEDYLTRPYMRYRMKTCNGKVIQYDDRLRLIIEVYDPTLSVERLTRIVTKKLRQEFIN